MGNGRNWVRANLGGLTPIAQPLSSLCWLACYRMLYKWKSLDPNTIEGKLKSAGLDFDAACKRGLLPNEMRDAAKALGLAPMGFGQSISAWDLKQRLTFSPLWLAGEWFKSSLHARLVIAASDDWVEYFDPWYGGTYGMDLKHKDLLDIFVHGDGKDVRGTDKLIGKIGQLSYWKP